MSLRFDVMQMGSQSLVTVRLDECEVTSFEISATEFERFVQSFEQKPVITVTHCDPPIACPATQDDLRLQAMARHVPLSVDMRQSTNGQWRASVWFNDSEDAEFWERIFKAAMQEATHG